MRIKGLQKVTLLDYPGKIACTIFLFGCNFRCGFCHNPELVVNEQEENLSRTKILEFLQEKRKYLDGVCFTGGEPLMTLDRDLLHEIKNLGYLIKIDTNGSFPEKLQELLDYNLVDFVAMDIKFSKDRYSELTDSQVNLADLEKSIKIISQIPHYEFRTTVIEDLHTEEELLKIALWLNAIIGYKPKKFVLQGFKVQDNLIDQKFKNSRDTTKEYLKNLKEKIEDYFLDIEIRS